MKERKEVTTIVSYHFPPFKYWLLRIYLPTLVAGLAIIALANWIWP